MTANGAIPSIHVIGAGLAGLSAAIALTEAGNRVTLYEAGPQAGGRCRSYHDAALGHIVDNGNHLLLSGNREAMAYLRTIGAEATLSGPGAPYFPFHDLETGEAWVLRPNRSRLPWWIFAPSRRVPGTRPADYLGLLKLARAKGGATVDALLQEGALRRNLMEPLAISTLNTPVAEAKASLMAAVLRETLMQGGGACVPLFPRASLAASLIDPALAWLTAQGATIRLGCRVAALRIIEGKVFGLMLPQGGLEVGEHGKVVLAVPPNAAAGLLPGLGVPQAHQAILNLHYRYAPDAIPAPIAKAGFTGLVRGTAEWVFVKPGHVSVTISAANHLVDLPAETLAARVWPEVLAALAQRLDTPLPACRVVKEKRATFAATEAEDARRPGARTQIENLVLAGDWTATGLPATIEGAIRSGRAAAKALLTR
jgi:squalene-associated FAD-dependent desaturase